MTDEELKDRKIRALYEASKSMPAEQRAAFLDGVCGDDSELRIAVERLLTDETVELDPDPALVVQGSGAGVNVGDYRLIRRLGSGGMGEVWEAERRDNGRRVALKLLSSRFVGSTTSMERFMREGQLAAGVSHPRSTFVYETGRDGDRLFIAMELMVGTTLADLVDGHTPLPPEQAVDRMLDVIEGLQAAHQVGVVHRDVKPSNCFLDSEGRVKVGDYGLSKSLATAGELTRSGSFMGTPAFAPPEQLRGEDLDERSDQYSVGATLFYLIAGRPPFEGDAVTAIAKISTETAPLLDSIRPDVPATLARIVARTLHKDPAKRFRSLRELRSALAPYRTEGTVAAEPVRRLNAFVVDLFFMMLLPEMAIDFVSGLSAGFARGARTELSALFTNSLAWAKILVPVIFVAYLAVCEAVWGQTFGKRLLRLCVQDDSTERPRPWRALVRAALLPGIPLALGAWHSLAQVAGFLLLLSTMNRRNGYRAVHDWASGTRVVRIRDRSPVAEVEIPSAAQLRPAASPRTFGPFREIGVIARSDTDELIQARDDQLNRIGWIWLRSDDRPLGQTRLELARPARLRWLQGGHRDARRWDAFEGVCGVPLDQAADHLTWKEARAIILRLAEELDAALTDGTLPGRLTPNSVWIDDTGGVRLVDVGLEGAASSRKERSREAMAVELLRSATGSIMQALQSRVPHRGYRSTAPARLPSARGIAFTRELAGRSADRATLDWAIERLRDLQSGPATLAWHQRLGALMLATIEGAVYALAATWLVRLGGVLELSPPYSQLLAVVPLALAGFAVGAAFRGGPAFRLSEIEVVTTTGRPAGRLPCGFRYLVAWAPILLLFLLTPMGSPSHTQAMLLGSFGLVAVFVMPLAIYRSVWRHPDRGFQDQLVGTRLVPR